MIWRAFTHVGLRFCGCGYWSHKNNITKHLDTHNLIQNLICKNNICDSENGVVLITDEHVDKFPNSQLF